MGIIIGVQSGLVDSKRYCNVFVSSLGQFKIYMSAGSFVAKDGNRRKLTRSSQRLHHAIYAVHSFQFAIVFVRDDYIVFWAVKTDVTVPKAMASKPILI